MAEVEITQADREALEQDVLLSIPEYLHKSIFRAFARHRARTSLPQADREGGEKLGQAGGSVIWTFTAEAFSDGTVNCDWHDVPGSQSHWAVSQEAKRWVKSQVDEMVLNPQRCPMRPPSQATHALVTPLEPPPPTLKAHPNGD